MKKNTSVPRALSARPMSGALAAGVVAAAFAFGSGDARAESNVVTTGTATAHLNFQITIPRFLFLQVGTGSLLANNTTVDTIAFAPTAVQVGSGTALAGTGGDLTNGAVTARVLGNGFGNTAVNLTATTPGALSNGAGSTIPWSEIELASAPTGITVVPAAAAILPHPGTTSVPFANSGATTASLTPTLGVINQAAKWTFQYKNTTVPAAGTYGGTVANNGEVTYTIALP